MLFDLPRPSGRGFDEPPKSGFSPACVTSSAVRQAQLNNFWGLAEGTPSEKAPNYGCFASPDLKVGATQLA